MKSFLKALTVVAATTFVSTANAGFISGEQSFQDVNGNSKSVNLSGLEWLSLDHTFGLSRDSIDGKAWTDNQGNTWDANEWRYATRAETSALVNSLWGGTFDGYGYNNYQGASWFAENFANGMFSANRDGLVNYKFAWYFYGATGECGTGLSCEGVISKAEDATASIGSHNVNTGSTQAVGYSPFLNVQNSDGSVTRAHQGLGYITEYNSGNELGLYSEFRSISALESFNSQGSLLVRNVSEPSTVLLFSMALFGLGIRARRKAKA